MNIITIDPSLISTAIIINSKPHLFTRKEDVYTKTNTKRKWFKLAENEITYHLTSQPVYSTNYSTEQFEKMNYYNTIINSIIEVINKNINLDQESKIIIEGYSYSSAAGPLIDLVTFSTLLRNQLLTITSNIIILAPTQLKQLSGVLTYKLKDNALEELKTSKKKEIIRNKKGIASGSFTKHDMMVAIIENEEIQHPYKDLLIINQAEILDLKTINKPFEDINDSFLMYYITLFNLL
jgi:hypothetical protein